MKVAIDCRSLRKKPAGVPNFLIGLINSLSAARQGWSFYLLSNADFSQEVKKKLRTGPNAFIVIRALPVFPRVATLWYALRLPGLLKELDIDLFYSPIPNLPFGIPSHIRTMITVHDMVYKLFPETMALGNKLINAIFHDRSINKADKLWAVSQYTKKEIEKFYPRRKCNKIETGTSIDKSVFALHAISPSEQRELLNRYRLRAPFILTVATLEPRKNLPFLISLMPLLIKDDLSLLIVGAKGWGNINLNDQTLSPTVNDRIKFAGFIPDEDLAKLYQQASVCVSTSINEGFCLPLLEAMQCGCPVVAAKNSGMIEVIEDAGLLVEGWDKDVWISSIRSVLENREHYAAAGFAKAKKYDWIEVASRMSNFMEERDKH